MTATRGTAVDVLVIGAGPAGLSAAVAAADAGRDVLILDQGLRPGGQIWRHRDIAALPRTGRDLVTQVSDRNIRIATGARVIDAVSPSELVVDFGGRIDRQGARAIVLATGAKERMLPFPGWTLPGIVGVGGLQALIKSGLDVAGARIVIAGSGPLLFPVAATAARAGADVLLVAEQAPRSALLRFALALGVKPGALLQGMRYRWQFRQARFRTGSWVIHANGLGRVSRVVVRHGARESMFDCDWLATGMGLVPNVDLAALLGCTIADGAIVVDAEQSTSVSGVWAAGECTGVKGDAAAIVEGTIAGRAAAGLPISWGARRRRAAGVRFGRKMARVFAPRPELIDAVTEETILCRCEDVTRRDVDPSWTQRQAKLWTRIGMGECQGTVCGAACAHLFGWQANVTRPPLGAPQLGDWCDALRATPGAGDATP